MNPIRVLRDRLGLSQEAFGETVGLTQSRVSDAERGEPLSRAAALRVLDTYPRELRAEGLTLEDLLRPHGEAA